ncbi:MAG: hypothetical protein OES15_06205 [Nitrosopumilus sp.]|jgi:hypothetical protein|nr:hypothetical protein [Nitrosopumilus sp.]MDH3853138.1 hypothetical protein [Nitrosopumilus sp.]
MLSFNITKLDIFQSYFFGEIDFHSDKYKINIQNERRGKVLKLPFKIKPKNEKIIVRMTGPGDLFVEDYLPYKGESEWLEIDSDEITYFLADHQDQCDVIEIMYE